MSGVLSKSVIIMFIFDFVWIAISTTISSEYSGLNFSLQIIITILTVLCMSFVLLLKSQYKIREFNIVLKACYLLFEGVILGNILPIILLMFFVPSGTVVKFAAANIFSIYIGLQIYRAVFNFYLVNIKRTKHIFIIGANSNGRLIADEILTRKALKMNISGFMQDFEQENIFIHGMELKVYNPSENLSEIIKKEHIDIIIIALESPMNGEYLTYLKEGIPNNVKMYNMSDFYEMITGKYFISKQSVNALFYEYMNNRSQIYDFCKRLFDIISALIILTVTFPVLLYIGLRVKYTDGGSAIYTQKRIGKDGKIFKLYKLRTMYLNDYVPNLGNLSQSNGQEIDNRVIPFCKFVRKARFDEIPQMINILRGDMSIVGPRAEWDNLVKIYQAEIPYYSCRSWMTTGWTGWAQINQGHCISKDDVAEKLQYDLYYIKHRNIMWEIGILVKAVFLALGGRHS